MWLILKIVAAVMLVMFALAVLAFWGFKRWLRRKVGGYQGAAEILGNGWSAPARLQLEAGEGEPGAGFLRLSSELHALGFVELGDLQDEHGAFELMRMLWNAQLGLAAAITEADDQAFVSVFAITADKHVLALSNAPGPEMIRPMLHWEIDLSATPTRCIARTQELLAGTPPVAATLPLLRSAYEAAYAARMDGALAQPPTRAQIEALARERRPQSTPADIDAALGMARSHWRSQAELALQDRYRRASRIDAVSWARIENDLHVVHDFLDADELCEMLSLTDADREFARVRAQAGQRGVALYETLLKRAPAQQRRALGTVERPFPATLFVRDQTATAPAAALRRHVYDAVDEHGERVQGSIQARSSEDAKRQLGERGLAEPRILIESFGGDTAEHEALDPALAAVAARSARESISISLLRAIAGNFWLWLPPTILLILSLREGMPFSGGDLAVFVYALVALAAMLVLVAPMFLYNQLLAARVRGNWRTARLTLFLLRRCALLGAPTAWQMVNEECKILAGSGHPARALALWETQRCLLTQEQYLTNLIGIHDAAGQHAQMIATQRQLLEVVADKALMTVDLAMALARHERAADEAEDLLARVSVDGLSELALSGYHFTRGLISAERSNFDFARRQFEQAIVRASTFNNPLIHSMVTELHGFLAWSLKRGGHGERAANLWRVIGPVLESRAGASDIVQRYHGRAEPASP